MVPRNTVKVEGADAERILKLMEVLEELDDVSRGLLELRHRRRAAGGGRGLRARR